MFIFIQLSSAADDKLTALPLNANQVGFLILLPGGVLNMSFKQDLLPLQSLKMYNWKLWNGFYCQAPLLSPGFNARHPDILANTYF